MRRRETEAALREQVARLESRLTHSEGLVATLTEQLASRTASGHGRTPARRGAGG